MVAIYKKIKYLILILFFGFLWLGCNSINTPIAVPTYIHIDSFIWQPSGQFRVNTHQITSVWAYYNNNPIGSFDLPATIPVITSTSGTGTLELSPGIAVDGFNNILGVYPFYQIDTFTFSPQPGKIITYEAKTGFYLDAITLSISSFQGQTGFSAWEGIGQQEPIIIGSVDSLDPPGGKSYGVISLSSALGDSVVDSSNIAFAIPAGAAFIELDYKCDIPFFVGLQATLDGVTSTPYFLGGIYPSAYWQKFYLSVADFAGQYQATTYNFYIKATLPAGTTSGKVYLANIQLVHF